MGNGLRELREERGWTHQQAADAVGVSRSQFIKLERGERGLTERTIGLAAKAFSVSRTRVLGDAIPLDAPLSPDADDEPLSQNVARPSEPLQIDLTKLKGPRNVPVLGTGSGGDEGDFRFNGQRIDNAPRPPGIQDRKGVYVIYVVGDSVSPRYEDGDPIYVDPHRRPAPRDYVVIELYGQGDDPGEAYVKRLVSRGGGKIVVEQFTPPKTRTFDESDVKNLHRVIPWTELIGI